MSNRLQKARITPRVTALVAVLAFSVSGCLIGTSEDTKYKGRYISEETLKKVEPGDTQDEVRSLLGSPSTSVEKKTGMTIWTYSYTQATTKSGAVFLLFGSSKTTNTEGAVYVEFDADDKVVKTWSEH